MEPDNFLFFNQEFVMNTLPKRLTSSEKGYIIGTIDASTNKFSVSDFPVLHTSRDKALREASRLLQTNTIPIGRKVVVLKVDSFVELNSNPIIVT